MSICVLLFRDFTIKFDGKVVPVLEARKVKELFSYLLLNQERPHRRQLLMTLLWEDSSEARAQKYLRQILWQLQSDLTSFFPKGDQQPLMVDTDWVHINIHADIWCDAIEFQKAYQFTQNISGSLLDTEQIHVLEEAITLYQGDLLESWNQNWCLIEREHCHNMFLLMLDKLMDACEVYHRYEDGIEYGRRALKQDYARERTYRRLMRLHSLLGDRNGAMRQYEQCVAALRAELDVAPAHSTQELFNRIRRDELVQTEFVKTQNLPTSFQSSGNLVEQLKHIHSNLGKIQALVQREIEEVKRFYSS
ncbi:MAG: bacterial transcriptional activator domain-containing protein [Anaerolineae bacterium]|nr:bacterial transcriptional activator domain-containing protein [Anaerolineae bacterium]